MALIRFLVGFDQFICCILKSFLILRLPWEMSNGYILLFPTRIVNAFLETRLNTCTIRNADNIFKIALLPFTGELPNLKRDLLSIPGIILNFAKKRSLPSWKSLWTRLKCLYTDPETVQNMDKQLPFFLIFDWFLL